MFFDTGNEKNAKAIARLVKLTKQNKIDWRKHKSPRSLDLNPSKHIDLVYEAEYKNKKLRAYKDSYKHFYDEDAYEWADKINLSIVDDDENDLYTFDETPEIYDLWKVIGYKVSGAEDFIESILCEE